MTRARLSVFRTAASVTPLHCAVVQVLSLLWNSSSSSASHTHTVLKATWLRPPRALRLYLVVAITGSTLPRSSRWPHNDRRMADLLARVREAGESWAAACDAVLRSLWAGRMPSRDETQRAAVPVGVSIAGFLLVLRTLRMSRRTSPKVVAAPFSDFVAELRVRSGRLLVVHALRPAHCSSLTLAKRALCSFELCVACVLELSVATSRQLTLAMTVGTSPCKVHLKGL